MPHNESLGGSRFMKTALLACMICIFSASVLAQRKGPPRFEDYPVRKRFNGNPAPISFRSCSLARTFRTMLKGAVNLGPNFAGHYGVNHWGCGTECIQIGIVDLKTGKVYMPAFSGQV